MRYFQWRIFPLILNPEFRILNLEFYSPFLKIKPVPSIFQSQKTVKKVKTNEEIAKDIQIEKTTYENIDLEIQGRHDVCLCPRIVPVVEAMSAITLADLILRNGE